MVQINGQFYPLTRDLDGVVFYLALDDRGQPFYIDQEPVKGAR